MKVLDENQIFHFGVINNNKQMIYAIHMLWNSKIINLHVGSNLCLDETS